MNLAWASFCAGSTPVGAVVVSGSGAIVAEGRGRRYELSAPGGQLASSNIAHAEVNALAQLGSGNDYDDHVLLTTLEPCGMCHGAAVQGRVGCLLYAAADPYAGTGSLDFGTPQAHRRPLRVIGPLDSARGRLAALLHLVWLVRKPAGEHVIAAQRSGLAALTSLAERAATQRLFMDAAALDAGGLADLQAALGSAIEDGAPA